VKRIVAITANTKTGEYVGVEGKSNVVALDNAGRFASIRVRLLEPVGINGLAIVFVRLLNCASVRLPGKVGIPGVPTIPADGALKSLVTGMNGLKALTVNPSQCYGVKTK
jgi:hypothetical protein